MFLKIGPADSLLRCFAFVSIYYIFTLSGICANIFEEATENEADPESCPTEWMHFPSLGTCILIPPHPADWNEAEQFCQSKQSHLISITSQHEAFIVRDLVTKSNSKFFTWIGLSRLGFYEGSGDGSGDGSGEEVYMEDEEASGTVIGNTVTGTYTITGHLNNEFIWSDGKPYKFNLFGIGEPSANGDCVAWDRPNAVDIWRAINCDYAQFFLCKMDALNATTDYLEGPRGTILSPNYPRNYSDLQRRHYFVRMPEEERILLELSDFQTEKDRDVLTIYDGFSERAKTMRRLSGSVSKLKLLSSSNALLLSFVSDEDIRDKGFNISYQTWKYPDLIQIRVEDSGQLESPNFPEPTEPMIFKHYFIQCDTNYHLDFAITDYSLQKHDKFSFHKTYDRNSRPILNNPPILPYKFSTTTSSAYFWFETSNEPYQKNSSARGFRFTFKCVFDGDLGEEIELFL